MTQEELNSIYEALDKDVDYAEQIAVSTVNSKTAQLDELMRNIYNEIVAQEEPATSSIEKYFLALSNCLYFLGDSLEKVGIYDDISKAKAKEKYNNAYLSYVNPVDGKKRTVAEAQTSAENESITESLVNTIYARAYKIFKYKIDTAQTMLSTLSKMLSKRMQDAQMSSQQGAGAEIKQYLVESPFKQFRETL